MADMYCTRYTCPAVRLYAIDNDTPKTSIDFIPENI